LAHSEKTEMTGELVFLMCDKGHGDGKRGGAYLILLLTVSYFMVRVQMLVVVQQEMTMGEGGLKKRTALQLFHTACNLTQQYASSEWNYVWSLCTGTACKAIKCPVLSRWEHVNKCSMRICFLHTSHFWMHIAKHGGQSTLTGRSTLMIKAVLLDSLQDTWYSATTSNRTI